MMTDLCMDPFTGMGMISLSCSQTDMLMYRVLDKLTNTQMDEALLMGWVIISSWINPEDMVKDEPEYVSNISFRLAKENMRLIVTADLYIPLFPDSILNIDSDNPGSAVAVVPSQSNELWKLRMASIAGYGPCGAPGPGLKKPMNLPDLMIVGLDIEVTTFTRKGKMPLPHDDIISITISNGGWFDKRYDDICICIYTFGSCKPNLIVDGREVTLVKVNSGAEAVLASYRFLEAINPDFVNIHNGFGFDLKHMAAVCAEMDGISDTFEERRLGNVGVGIFWRLPYGIMCIDSMYYTDKTARKDWVSISLGHMANELDLPPKLDSGTMMIDPMKDYDLTQMIVYNCRDSDLHALIPRHADMKMPEFICSLAGASRSTIWDSIANNTGLMDFCVLQSTAMAAGVCLDLSRTVGTDENGFEGGFVLEPVPGCYKGVIQIDGNSLYGSLMAKVGIFIDRCARSNTVPGLESKMDAKMPAAMEKMEVGDVIENADVVGMRNEDGYMAVYKGGPTMLSVVLDEIINLRTQAKKNGNVTLAAAYKILVCSFYGMFGSKHGAMSAKTCAEITTYLARYYLRCMVRIAESCGYSVRYGDTDSIFVEVRGKNAQECMEKGMKVKMRIYEEMKGTTFESIGADIKGNYMSILISSKKKYEAVTWDGDVETKGLAPVKKDTLPVVKYVMSKVLEVVNSSMTKDQMTECVIRLLAKVISALKNNKLPLKSQVIEKKINNQPHFVYVDGNEKPATIQTDLGIKVTNVSKKWVVRRIKISIDRVFEAADLNSFSEFMFACQTRTLLSAREAK